MNGTMLFDSIGTQKQKVFCITKADNGNIKIINSKTADNKNEIVGVPLISNGYTDPSPTRRDHKEGNMGLYRPISPSIDEDFATYAYRNSPSPAQEGGMKFSQVNNFAHLNGQTLIFEKFPHLSPELFTHPNSFQQQSSNANMQYSFNNNYRSHNNNINNINYGQFIKSRSNSQHHQFDSNNANTRDQRRQPLNYFRNHNNSDPMVRRAYGLTHRFKSRSNIMKIDPNPAHLLNGGPYDQLSQAIYDVFTSKAQKRETYENKIQLWKDLFLYIRKCVNRYALYIVGSTMTGFGLNSSDIDMCLLIRPCTEDPRLDSLHQLHYIKNHLLKYGLIIHSELILAKVPILKFREQSRGFEIDLNCNNSVGIYNTHLLYCYARCDWRVRPLVIMVKLWAQANSINDAKNLTVSSYSWTLMLIHYLQCGVSPVVLPCLHTLYPEHFNADKSRITDVHEDLDLLEEFRSFNTQSLAELFIGFFDYYANFDFDQFAVSVRAGCRLLIEDCKHVKAPKNDQNQWKYLCIEEPFDFTNTARSVYDIVAFRHIKTVITKSYEELVFDNDGLPSLICSTCKQQTNQSYIFRSNCRKADDALKSYLHTGELIKPDMQKPHPHKRPLSQISPVKDIQVVSKRVSTNDSSDIKKMKLGDGTEIITLCISQSDDAPSQDESSQDGEQLPSEQFNLEVQESEEDGFLEPPPYKRPATPQQVETDIFPCDHCDKSFPLEQLLDIHATNHHRERDFACPQCDNKFFTKYDMLKHQRTHKEDKPFSCSVCQKVFGREALLRRHEMTHTTTPKYACAECEKVFVLKDDLDNHMKKHEKSRPFACALCKKSFVFKQGLERHMRSFHSEEKPYKCNYCEGSFNTAIRLTRHITTHAGLRPYPCKICGRTFLLSHHLTRHMRSHYEKKPDATLGRHRCDICSMSFRRKDSLINHNAIHSMVNLRCVICNTSFENAKMVKDHITTHLQGLAFPCELCDYSFDTEKQLIEHEVKHAEMEYEEQIEKEIISEVKHCETGDNSLEESEVDEEFIDNESGEIRQNKEDREVTSFYIPDIDNPLSMIPTENQPSVNPMLDCPVQTVLPASISEGLQKTDVLSHFFKTETVGSAGEEEEEEEASHVTGEDEENVANNGIKPIYRVEGTKMYQRKGPIRRKIPNVQPQCQNVTTASLDEINEPPNMGSLPPDAIHNLPSKKPVNVKVGDKVVRVQKFIISKEEMKHMAKLGILELKNGKVIMKTPGQPILNAKIKPVKQSDIDSLMFGQKTQHRPQIKQYERRGNSSQSFTLDPSTGNIIEGFN